MVKCGGCVDPGCSDDQCPECHPRSTVTCFGEGITKNCDPDLPDPDCRLHYPPLQDWNSFGGGYRVAATDSSSSAHEERIRHLHRENIDLRRRIYSEEVKVAGLGLIVILLTVVFALGFVVVLVKS